MLARTYGWLHARFSRKDQRGEYSAGLWQENVRNIALDMCLRADGPTIELGCGEGLFLEKLAAVDRKVAGIDIWHAILLKAGNRLSKAGKLTAVANICSIPFVHETFKSVVCINVLFNLHSPNAVRNALKEASRICAEGGSVIFDIRNSLNPLLYLKYKLARYYDKTVADLPLRTYRLHWIKKVLEECGMEMVERKAVGFPYNAFAPIFVIEARKR